MVFCQIDPWPYGGSRPPNLKKAYRRTTFLVSRLLANLGVNATTPILARFHSPADAESPRKRWQDGLYLDQSEEWDDPYRFFRG